MHYLCTKTGIKEIRACMADVAEVVRSMVERVKVDLQGDELAHAVCIFDLKAWREREERHRMQPLIKSLAKALKLDHASVLKDFYATARLLSQLVQAAEAGNKNPSNRLAWSWVLIPAWRARFMPPSLVLKNLQALGDLICFYLSLKMNTTTLERNLGSLCRQLVAHSGPHAADGSTLGDVLQVALDGPQQESQLFESVHVDGKHQLVPTDFARSCAKLWIQCFGRRFHYKYKEGEASSSVGGKKRKRSVPAVPAGTFAAVQKGRREAVKRLCSKSASSEGKVSSFVPSLDLVDFASQPSQPFAASLVGTRWSGTASTEMDRSSKKKSAAFLFSEHTERKRARPLLSLMFLFQ